MKLLGGRILDQDSLGGLVLILGQNKLMLRAVLVLVLVLDSVLVLVLVLVWVWVWVGGGGAIDGTINIVITVIEFAGEGKDAIGLTTVRATGGCPDLIAETPDNASGFFNQPLQRHAHLPNGLVPKQGGPFVAQDEVEETAAAVVVAAVSPAAIKRSNHRVQIQGDAVIPLWIAVPFLVGWSSVLLPLLLLMMIRGYCRLVVAAFSTCVVDDGDLGVDGEFLEEIEGSQIFAGHDFQFQRIGIGIGGAAAACGLH